MGKRILTAPAARLARLFLCAALVLAPSLCADAAPLTASAGAIQASYDQIDQAFTQRDMARCMSYFTPDYTDLDEKGVTIDRDQARQRYQDHLDKIKTMQCRITIQSVTPTPAGILVEVKMHADGTGEKKVLFARIKGSFTNDLWARDLWVNTPQGWRLKHRQTLQDATSTHAG